MITNEALERVRGWFTGRLPEEWRGDDWSVTVDREEITVVLVVPDVTGGSDAETAEARAGRAKAFREETRAQRMKIAREAEHRYDRKVSWGVRVGDHDGALDARVRAGDDPAAPAAAPGARHPGRSRGRPVAVRGAGLVRPPGRRSTRTSGSAS